MPAPALPRPARVAPITVQALAAALGSVPPVDAQAEQVVTGITHDSGAVRPGDLYAAVRGARVHGADFAAPAVAAGAAALLTDPAGEQRCRATGRPVLVVADARAALGPAARLVYGAPTDALLVVGVTGTNGKTTTSYLVEGGLRAAGHRTGLIGTVETRIDTETIPSPRTTPEATDLQALFAVMRERGITAAAMEVSSHALALHRVDGATFAVAGFTNLSQDHLDFHADMEDYFAAKARLFTPALSQRGVVDVDDPYGARLATMATVPVATLGRQGQWRPSVRAGSDRTGWEIADAEGHRMAGETQLLGEHNARNAALAALALHEAGVPGDAIRAGIAAVAGVPGRMERVDAGQPFLALVDYAHTPEALATMLRTGRRLADGRRVIVVIGCGGDRDRAKRPFMGAAAATLADVAVLTSDNPRSEDPDAILAAVVAGARDSGGSAQIVVERDRQAAITRAVELAAPGDVVVVAGKGHEQGQEFADHTVPFDDRDVLRAALAAVRSAR